MYRAFILGIILIITMTFIAKAHDFIVGEFAFNLLSDRKVELVALPDGKKYESILRIPAGINLYDARLYLETASPIARNLAGQVIPCNVVKIGDRAFKDCKRLISLDLSAMFSLEIGTEAISECSGLQEIIMSDLEGWSPSPIKIGNRAFMNSNCNQLHLP